MIELDIAEEVEPSLLSEADAEQAVMAALQVSEIDCQQPAMCIRLADDAEVHALNAQWRHKDRVTDVLSFPMQDGPEIDPDEFLGDMILAMPFVVKEAARLGLPPHAHAMHLMVHGTLHLLGLDHEDDTEAAYMQGLERQAMQILGLHDPYPDLEDDGV